ncbi:MAG TPA: galactosyltransferase-related protein [Candidatus Dormibacteraeota bacterium]|nr:galactosyltransferase-related protein [Candidatus Dormibacteraeota bacterium]
MTDDATDVTDEDVRALSATLVDLALSALDPDARVSLPAWRRAEAGYTALHRDLVEATSEPVDVAELFADLARRPQDRRLHARLVNAVGAALRRDPALATRFAAAADRLHEGVWLHPFRGAAYPPDPAGAEPVERQVSALRAAGDRLAAGWPRSAAGTRTQVGVVIEFRAGTQLERLRNLLACLVGLLAQSLPRERYRLVVVEQDAEPRHRALFAHWVDEYVFAANAGVHNSAWGRNVGVRHVSAHVDAICLLDADFVVDGTFLERGARELGEGRFTLLPHDRLLYLDELSTAHVVRRLASTGARPEGREHLRGYALRAVFGACWWTTPGAYWSVGGMDERYEGWGPEDNDFTKRLAAVAPLRRLPEVMWHLRHPRPVMNPNRHRLETAWPGDAEPGRPDRYAAEPAPGRPR